MIITISGNPGSGKSTVAKMLANKLNYERIYAGGIFRAMSQHSEHNPNNLPFEQWYVSLADNPEMEKKVDESIARAAKEKDNLVLEGRMAFMAGSHGKKKLDVFIAVDYNEGARRVFEQKLKDTSARTEESHYHDAEHAVKEMKKRAAVEKERYLSLYNIDITDMNHYDLIINATSLDPEQVADKTLEAVKDVT